MRKLALNDEILMKVEKPARYIGNEVNSVMKDKREKLYLNRKQLEFATIQIVQDCMRIFDDSVRIIESTTKPDVFFSRLDLAEKELATLVYIEPYMKQVKAITMNQSMQELMNKFQNGKDVFLDIDYSLL